MLCLQFIGLLGQVQHFLNTVDCSCLWVATIALVYIVVAGMFLTDETDWYVYVIWKSDLLVFFLLNTLANLFQKLAHTIFNEFISFATMLFFL